MLMLNFRDFYLPCGRNNSSEHQQHWVEDVYLLRGIQLLLHPIDLVFLSGDSEPFARANRQNVHR